MRYRYYYIPENVRMADAWNAVASEEIYIDDFLCSTAWLLEKFLLICRTKGRRFLKYHIVK
jgi:hypothetical protein